MSFGSQKALKSRKGARAGKSATDCLSEQGGWKAGAHSQDGGCGGRHGKKKTTHVHTMRFLEPPQGHSVNNYGSRLGICLCS